MDAMIEQELVKLWRHLKDQNFNDYHLQWIWEIEQSLLDLQEKDIGRKIKNIQVEETEIRKN